MLSLEIRYVLIENVLAVLGGAAVAGIIKCICVVSLIREIDPVCLFNCPVADVGRAVRTAIGLAADVVAKIETVLSVRVEVRGSVSSRRDRLRLERLDRPRGVHFIRYDSLDVIAHPDKINYRQISSVESRILKTAVIFITVIPRQGVFALIRFRHDREGTVFPAVELKKDLARFRFNCRNAARACGHRRAVEPS